MTSNAFTTGGLSFTKVRSLTRLATAANETELLEIAERTPPATSAEPSPPGRPQRRPTATRPSSSPHRAPLAHRTRRHGHCVPPHDPEQAAVLTAAVDEHVMRSDGREPADPRAWQRRTARVNPPTVGIAGTAAGRRTGRHHQRRRHQPRHRGHPHVRADGCTLDDGTPISGSIVEQIADTSALRVAIHDAESHPVNVSGKHRHHTKRQKLVVKGATVSASTAAAPTSSNTTTFPTSATPSARSSRKPNSAAPGATRPATAATAPADNPAESAIVPLSSATWRRPSTS